MAPIAPEPSGGSRASELALRTLLARLWHHVGHRRRRQFVWLMGLILLSAFAEVVSLGAVMPFIGVLAVPDRVFEYTVVADLAQLLGVTAPDQLVLPLTVAFATAAVP